MNKKINEVDYEGNHNQNNDKRNIFQFIKFQSSLFQAKGKGQIQSINYKGEYT